MTPQDKLLLNSFVTFAVSPEAGTAAKLPFEPDGVRIGLASNLMESIGPSHVAQPAAWTLNSPAFRGGTGPFFPLKAIADHFAETGPDPTSPTRGFAMTLGEHPHCASGPVAPPEEVADMRHISIQPDENSIANCLEWFTVDLFVTKSGRIKAVTYDLWKP